MKSFKTSKMRSVPSIEETLKILDNIEDEELISAEASSSEEDNIYFKKEEDASTESNIGIIKNTSDILIGKNNVTEWNINFPSSNIRR